MARTQGRTEPPPVELGRPEDEQGRKTRRSEERETRSGLETAPRKFYSDAFICSPNETRMHYTWIAGDINFLSWTCIVEGVSRARILQCTCVAKFSHFFVQLAFPSALEFFARNRHTIDRCVLFAD